MGQAVAILLCILPTALEIIDDSRGESKKGKVRDFFLAVIFYCGLALFSWEMFHVAPLKSIALMLGVRVACFDYIIQFILIRRGIIVGKWWSYHGKTARFDRLIARIDWRIVMAARVILFAASAVVFR